MISRNLFKTTAALALVAALGLAAASCGGSRAQANKKQAEAARQFAEILLHGLAADTSSVSARRAEASRRPARNREGGADVKNHRDKNKKR